MSRPFSDWPEIMTADDCKTFLGMGHVEAYALFNRPDFRPLLINPTVRRGKRVGKHALRQYLNKGATIHDAHP